MYGMLFVSAFISRSEERKKIRMSIFKKTIQKASLPLSVFIQWIECKHDEKGKLNIEKHSVASFNCQFNAFIELSLSFILRTEYEDFFFL